jgi:hypothetical protein
MTDVGHTRISGAAMLDGVEELLGQEETAVMRVVWARWVLSGHMMAGNVLEMARENEVENSKKVVKKVDEVVIDSWADLM